MEKWHSTGNQKLYKQRVGNSWHTNLRGREEQRKLTELCGVWYLKPWHGNTPNPVLCNSKTGSCANDCCHSTVSLYSDWWSKPIGSSHWLAKCIKLAASSKCHAMVVDKPTNTPANKATPTQSVPIAMMAELEDELESSLRRGSWYRNLLGLCEWEGGRRREDDKNENQE